MKQGAKIIYYIGLLGKLHLKKRRVKFYRRASQLVVNKQTVNVLQ